MARALAAYQRALAGRDHLICYASRPTRTWRCCRWFARARLRLRHRLRRRARARAGRRRRPGAGRLLRRRQDARRDGARARRPACCCFNVESVGELELLSRRSRSEPGARARVSLRVNPDVDAKTHPYISTGLRGNKFGIAHDEALAAYRARRARCPGSRWSASTATSARRSPRSRPTSTRSTACSTWSRRVEARRHRASRHLDLGGGLGITYTRRDAARCRRR